MSEKLDEVNAAVNALQTSVDTLQANFATEIQALKDQIAAGGTVSEADLDAVLLKVQAVKADVDSTPTT